MRSLGVLPMWIRMPLGLGMLAVLLSFQGLAYMGHVSLESARSSSTEQRSDRTRDGQDQEVVRSVIGKPVHMAGTYYPEDAAPQTPQDSGSGDLWMWATMAFGALAAAFIIAIAAIFGFFSPVPPEEPIAAASLDDK